MVRNSTFTILSFLGLFCFSFSYWGDSNQAAQTQALLSLLAPHQEVKGFGDALKKGAYQATSQLASTVITQGFIIAAKGTWEKISRIKTTLEKDSPLSCSELAIINNDIYDSLLPYFSLSAADASKDKRAAALKDELTDSNLLEAEMSSLDADCWINKRYTAEVLIVTYLNAIEQAKETFKRKIEEQKNLWTVSIMLYTLTGSSKAKPYTFNVVTVFELLEYNLTKLLELVRNAHSEKELIANRHYTKLYFTTISK